MSCVCALPIVRAQSTPRPSSTLRINSPRRSITGSRLLAAKSAAALAPRVDPAPALVCIGSCALLNCVQSSVNRLSVSALARQVAPDDALPIVVPLALIQPSGADDSGKYPSIPVNAPTT